MLNEIKFKVGPGAYKTGILLSEHPHAQEPLQPGLHSPAWWVSSGPLECALRSGRGPQDALLVPRHSSLPRPQASPAPSEEAPLIQASEAFLHSSPARLGPSLGAPSPSSSARSGGGAAPAGGPDGGAAPSRDTFSGFQKEHFLSCLIFSSFKCKWRGFAPRLA